jgi:hypothetical protein
MEPNRFTAVSAEVTQLEAADLRRSTRRAPSAI